MKYKIVTYSLLAALACTGVTAPAVPVMAEETQDLQGEASSLQALSAMNKNIRTVSLTNRYNIL